MRDRDEDARVNVTGEDKLPTDEETAKLSDNLWPNESWKAADGERFFADEDEDDEERPPRIPRWMLSILALLVLVGFIIISMPVVCPLLFDNMDYLNQNIELGQKPMVEKVRQAVVGITVVGHELGSQRTGTGFAVSTDGWILTNVHVVKDARSIKVTLEDGKEYYAAEYRQLKSFDIAALKIKAQNIPCVSINKSLTVTAGDDLTIVGNPLGFMRIAVRGPVLAVYKYNPTDQGGMLEMAAAIRPGSSGSPMLDNNGQAVGIIFGWRENTAGNKQTTSALGLSLDLVMDELMTLGIVD